VLSVGGGAVRFCTWAVLSEVWLLRLIPPMFEQTYSLAAAATVTGEVNIGTDVGQRYKVQVDTRDCTESR